jgi:hypothetical protein
MLYKKLSVLSFVAASMSGFAPRSAVAPRSCLHAGVVATPVDNVMILADTAAIGDRRVRHIVCEATQKDITECGYFTLAILGGSILKMLVGDDIL